MFWIIWSPTGVKPPTVTFSTLETAKHAAEHMARKHPGQVFHVMELTATVVKNDIKWTYPEATEEIPF